MEGFDAKEFKRQLWLRSEPSVDITKVCIVHCNEHTLKESEYQRLLDEFGVKPDTALMGECNTYELIYGPRLTK